MRPVGTPSSYRSICLLAEAGKLLERVMARRLFEHLEVTERLSDLQFGFRKNKSTINAIEQAKELIKEGVEVEGISIAVSLDVQNAFNSLPLGTIKEALAKKECPNYLRVVVGSYLENRSLKYVDSEGQAVQRRMSCGIPQGSVLGPLLWIMIYDAILEKKLLKRSTAICFADNTLLVVADETLKEAVARTDVAIANICGEISDMSLKVSPSKTEVVVFARRGTPVPENTAVMVCGRLVVAKPTMKYLGLTIDKN